MYVLVMDSRKIRNCVHSEQFLSTLFNVGFFWCNKVFPSNVIARTVPLDIFSHPFADMSCQANTATPAFVSVRVEYFPGTTRHDCLFNPNDGNVKLEPQQNIGKV